MSVSCGDATACYGCRKVRGAEREEDVKEVERTEGFKGLGLPLGYLQIMIVVGYFPALDLGQTEIGYVDF